jgi:hypothetical protein
VEELRVGRSVKNGSKRAMETTRRAGCRHTGRQTATGSIRYYQVLSGGRGHTEAFQKGAQGEQAPQGAANG